MTDMPFQRPTRRQFLAGLGVGGVAAVAGCASSRSPPATASLDWPSDEWPVVHGTATNTGYSRSKHAPRTDPTIAEWQLWDQEEWQVNEDTIQYGLTSSPVVADGTLFVATGLPGGHSANEDGIVLATRRDDGERFSGRRSFRKVGPGRRQSPTDSSSLGRTTAR